MKKSDTLYINEFDIAKGVPEDTCNCPIALALQRDFNTYNVLVESYDAIYVHNKKIQIIEEDENKVDAFIEQFDRLANNVDEDEWPLYKKYNIHPFSFRYIILGE